MQNFSPSPDFAKQLDAKDPLAKFREQFVISDPNLIYFDGNSLGRLTKASAARAKEIVEQEWGVDLIRGWNKGWWDAPARIGDKVGKLLGAAAGQVVISDTVSINLFKLAGAALKLKSSRKKIVTDTFNFPSDLYILQGLNEFLSNNRQDKKEITNASDSRRTEPITHNHNYNIVRIGSQDNDITPDLAALEKEIDENTALVTLSHVVFKSGYIYDMQRITQMAHDKGALVLWDLSHSAGSVEVELDKCNADFAIGCTYKYLNGGPGAPAFLYVNKKIQGIVTSPIWGWWGQNKPFDFDLDYLPAEGAQRFLVGTQPMISMLTMETALDPFFEAGMSAIRAKSVLLTEYAIALQDSILAPLGFTLGSPRDVNVRGSHVSIRHPEGYRINRALIEDMNLIPDFRAPDNLRLGFAPLYLSFVDMWEGFDRIRKAAQDKLYEKYPKNKLTVT